MEYLIYKLGGLFMERLRSGQDLTFGGTVSSYLPNTQDFSGSYVVAMENNISMNLFIDGDYYWASPSDGGLFSISNEVKN